MPPKVSPSELIAKLKRRQVLATAELQTRLKRAQQAVAVKIEAAAARQQIAAQDPARQALFAQITSVYDVTAAEIDAWMKDQVEKTAVEWHNQAKKDIKTLTGAKPLVSFDRKLVKRYWELVHGGNQRFLAGVYTERMAAGDIRQLRASFLDAFRQQTIEGWTVAETHKALQSKWDSLAKNLRSDRFVDATGRKWANADYLNMLTRTTFQRVHRESYVDGIVEEGFELARIVGDGEPCSICRAWTGVVVDVSGKQKSHFPSLSQAYDGGWGHPNCGCRIEAMIPEVDKVEIDRQRDQPAVDWNDPKSVQGYNDNIRVKAKRDDGMSKAEAERDLKRDKIKRELELARLDHEAAVDAIPDEVLDKMDPQAIPRVVIAKKGEEVNVSRNSSLGGIIQLEPGAKPEDFTKAFNELQTKRGVITPAAPTPAPAPAAGNQSVMSPEVKKAVDAVTKQGAGNEKFICITPDGKTHEHISGSSGGLVPTKMEVPGSSFIHNHPSGFQNIKDPAYQYGRSLSTEDMMCASQNNYKEMIAVTPRRIYKIEAGPKGWPSVDDIYKTAEYENFATVNILSKRVAAGRLSEAEANVIGKHWENIEIAKKLGMKYSWTRVKI